MKNFPVYQTPENGDLVYLYFKGNNMDLGPLCDSLPPVAKVLNGTIYAVEYPGYGALSQMGPSEKGLYDAADALWNYVTEEKCVCPAKIVVWGFSLGSLCASYLASKYPSIHGVILESAFASGMNVLSKHFSLVSRFLHGTPMRVPFSNISHLCGSKNPRWRFCMFHGGADDMISPIHHKDLKSAVPEQNFCVGRIFKESGHIFKTNDFMNMLIEIRQCMEADTPPSRK